VEFWNLYRIIRKRLWMILFLVIATVGATIGLVMMRPPTYTGTATVRVAINSPSVSDVGRLDWYTAGILFSTIQETILSRTILQEVIDKDFLGITPDDFRQAVGVTRVGNSNLLKIEVKSTAPDQAKQLTNDVATTFIKYNQDLLNNESASSISYYEEQLKLAESNYNKARDAFRDSLNQPNARAAENQFITAQAAYQAANDKLDAVRLINRFPDLRPASVTIAEPAVTPTEPEGRQLARYTLIALLASVLLGVFIATSIEYLDTTIKSPYEVSGELGMPVLGLIPHFRRGVSGFAVVLANLDLPIISPLIRWRQRRLESRIVPVGKLTVEGAESFRKARISLITTHRQRQLAGQQTASQLLITSSRSNDGKSTITAHLGSALARAGYQVVLVDADLRRPTLHSHLGLVSEGPGLIQVLQGEANLEEAIHATGVPNLAVVVSGSTPTSQTELLDSDQFSSVLTQLNAEFDFVLVDSPALGLYTDAAGLAARIGHVFLILDATRRGTENEVRSVALLREAGAVVEGVFLNKIHPDYVNPTKLHDLPRHIVPVGPFVENGTNGTNGSLRNGHGSSRGEVAGRLH
jgi:capsular exopolysaccharide synthesis family protein